MHCGEHRGYSTEHIFTVTHAVTWGATRELPQDYLLVFRLVGSSSVLIQALTLRQLRVLEVLGSPCTDPDD